MPAARPRPGYGFGMNETDSVEAVEKLTRVRAPRRDAIVDLLVHYEVHREDGCAIYRILTVDED